MSLSSSDGLLARELSCPICMQLFSEPVMLPCGHNYCLSCIQQAIASEKVPHCCPECREEYEGEEVLQRNFKLCNIIEGYKATTGTSRDEAEVLCDQCLGTGTPAVKTCLKCEISLCSQHLHRHSQKESFKSHMLVEPLSDPGSTKCPLHSKALEYFCGSDRTFLCASCFIEGSHQDHDIKTFASAEADMRKILECHEKAVRSKLHMTDTLLQRGIGDEGIFKAANDKLAAKAMALLGNMANLVNGYQARLSQLLEEEQRQLQESWQSSLRQMIGQQEALRGAQQDLLSALKETDECRFVQHFVKIEPQAKEAIASSVAAPVPQPLNVKRLCANMRTEDFKAEMGRLLQALHTLLNPLELTFNTNTAHHNLLLSNDLRTVKYSASRQPHLDHPERFLTAPQVLCLQGFSSGEHVWVVEVGESMWSVGLCYKSVPRRGDHSRLGHNPVSWRLQWKNKKLTACHASSNVALPETVPPVRIEVALDYEGGTLSLHSTMGPRKHLYTFKASFREPVYPAFSIHSTTSGSWITLKS
ncbi:E3 ubiquitin/ISG15 ligase TRIM25-like [Megalops cyprinoides]|uniref:E3 ubiquitin/ISG15 ligase TRIM25-like n=1 Tax=Megalops cyprinoides TaxID=118141 RepID=UPI0018647E83|nr:E3 ubiquitin/ISG15 ligase TRIM25-like [Megalops cyprinoides]